MEIATEVDVGLLFAMTRSDGPTNSNFAISLLNADRLIPVFTCSSALFHFWQIKAVFCQKKAEYY